MRKVHTDLVRSAGLEDEAKQRDVSGRRLTRKYIENLVMSSGVATEFAAGHGDLEAVRPASREACVNCASRARKPAPYKRQVAPMQAAIPTVALELLRKILMGGVRFRDDEKAGRIFIQPMHDAGPPDAANAR